MSLSTRKCVKQVEKPLTKQQQISAEVRLYYNHCRFCNGWFRIRYPTDDVCENCRSGFNEDGVEVY